MPSNMFQTENNSAPQSVVNIESNQGFQLIQEKLVKIMATTQAVIAICAQMSKLVDQKKATIGRIAMVKAYVTTQLRDVVRWGR